MYNTESRHIMVPFLDTKNIYGLFKYWKGSYMYQHANLQVCITIGHKNKITFNIIMIISMHVINVIVIIYILNIILSIMIF